MFTNPQDLLVRLLVGSLITWRLCSLLTFEYGPADVFENLRIWAGSYAYSEDGEPTTFLGGLLVCLWCVSLWVSLPVSIWLFYPSLIGVVAGWLAVSAGAILFDDLIWIMKVWRENH